MIDLKELDKEIDALLAQETAESLRKWMQDYQNEKIQSYIGEGEFCKNPVEEYYFTFSMGVLLETPLEPESSNVGEYKYAAAA